MANYHGLVCPKVSGLPLHSYSFRMGLQPSILLYGGVWILAQIQPSHWSYICTLQIHQESIQLSSLLISWSWRRQQKIRTKTYSKNQIQRLKQAGFPNDKFPQSWTYNSELWDMFVPKNGSPFSRKANFQVPDAALQGCMVSETYPSNSKNGETWWDLLQKSTWLFVCQTELAPKML